VLRGRDMRRDGLDAALLEFMSQHSDLSLVAISAHRSVSRKSFRENAPVSPLPATAISFCIALRHGRGGVEERGAEREIILDQV
jgi:hypothetical protein